MYTTFNFAKTKYNWEIGNSILNHIYVYKIYYVCINRSIKKKETSLPSLYNDDIIIAGAISQNTTAM